MDLEAKGKCISNAYRLLCELFLVHLFLLDWLDFPYLVYKNLIYCFSDNFFVT